MRDHELVLVLWLAELIKAGPEAAEAQGVDRSTYERLIFAVADEEVLYRAGQLADLIAPDGREVFDQFLTRVQAQADGTDVAWGKPDLGAPECVECPECS
jgi:hypothetical protein